MRRFWVLLRKELRELVTAQMLLPFVVVIVMFVALGQTLSSVGGEQGAGPYPVTVIDLDRTAASQLVIDTLEQSGFEARLPEEGTAEAAVAVLRPGQGNIVLQIPQGFEANLRNGSKSKLGLWTAVRTFSFLGNRDVTAMEGALVAVNSAVAAQIAEDAAPSVDPALLQAPVEVTQYVRLGEQQAQTSVAAVMGFVGQQTTFIPIVLFVVIIFAAQMIATAIATEKENKTLETLLSYPVSRASIVTSKMVAAGLVALASAGAYMLGMQQYMKGIESGMGGTGVGQQAAAQASEAAMQRLGLTFGPADYALLGLTLFAGILVALSMAIILGAFAENVKSVQSLLTPLMVLLLVPYFLTLFLDLSALPDAVRIGVMAIPFTYPFITGPNLFLGNYGIVWFGIFYQLLWFAVFVFIAARVFSSDRIL
ncbi:MAG TPA: ABC transporter permease, partial [Coriobacteriia bacterium]|nr:ABC transporter permease [Coriobacteriia bacterium]